MADTYQGILKDGRDTAAGSPVARP